MFSLAIALLLFALALLPRLFTLDAFVTWDEPTWVFRSARFLEALRQGRWADTAQAGHPGVITMWAGALGVAVHSATDPVAAQALADVLAAGELDVQDTAALRVLGEFLPLARLPVAVLTALTVAACYVLARRLFGLPTALLAALLLAFDPFFLAHSRLLHVDALAASFMTLSLLSLLAYLVDGQRLRDAALSGFCAALAVLTKSPAAFLVPFTLLVFGVRCSVFGVRCSVFGVRRGGLAATGEGAAIFPWRGLLLWGLAAALTLPAFWPALWADPWRALRFVLGTAERHATTPHVNNFWFGQVVRDPGLPFYLLSFAFRLTPVTGLGLLAALPLLARRRPHRTLLLVLLGYVVLFVLALTAGAKKFDRYLLPAFPVLDLVAAWGIVAGLRWLARWRNLGQRASRAVLVAGMAIAVLAQAAGTLPHHPYYLTYYNPLLGGGRRAVQAITVGWGEGLDQAVRYLNRQPAAEELEVAAWGVAGIAPLLRGHVHVLNERSAVLADYVVLNVGDVQFGSPYISDYYGRAEPEYVVRLHGVEYAWVYRNDRYVEHLEALEGLVGEGDVVVFAGRSQVSKHWPAARPRLVLDPAGDEAQIAQALNGVAQPDGTVWYVAFAGDDAERDRVRRQLDTHALPVAQYTLPPLTVTAYRILSETAFAPLRADVPVEASFAGRLSLVGLGLSGMRLAPSQKLDIILRWQAINSVEADYTAFVHLLDEEGKRLAQHDELLSDATGRPTSAWAVGEPHGMRFLLDIPQDAPPGDYVLVVGLYRADTGDRLWLDGVKGMQDNTAYPLAVVHVAAP
ncbi:MAG: glycosyltransferase family 39 protein [Anaerolineae bacterium]|nr:glycosyltransferase family 39 protein [Anaerolineae bacterium]